MVKNLPARQETWVWSLVWDKVPWRRGWQPTPVFLPGKSHGQGRLAGYSKWGLQKSQTWLQDNMSTFINICSTDSGLPVTCSTCHWELAKAVCSERLEEHLQGGQQFWWSSSRWLQSTLAGQEEGRASEDTQALELLIQTPDSRPRSTRLQRQKTFQ